VQGLDCRHCCNQVSWEPGGPDGVAIPATPLLHISGGAVSARSSLGVINFTRTLTEYLPPRVERPAFHRFRLKPLGKTQSPNAIWLV
jgi:hypothetical protein